jgi:hypothetical protein
VRAVQAMSMNPVEPVQVPELQNYRIEFVRKIVKNLSDMDKSLPDMRTQVLLTGNAQPSASDQVISVCIFCARLVLRRSSAQT